MAYNHQQRFMQSSSGSGGSSPRPRGALSTSRSGGDQGGALGAIADWAVRSLDPDVAVSPVAVYVDRCCDPSNREPNLAMNLELADFIKQKKANTPREAAVEVVRRVNSRHPHVSMLALHLLDHLVKNCGYPFHLQIATKEFLNELVKRFPERPPVFPTPVQNKILELIHEWKQTICVTSKHKEDLVHIRDMHRLLGYKGYRFPNVDSRATGVMNAEHNNLQSPEELEEEDREAQAAKLQELIRRGTPKDLAQAQELMKIMSGAEPESKPDYSQRVRKELDKVQSRAILLNNMLDNAGEAEKFARGDAYDQIASHLQSVQPRLQKMISDAHESEDDEATEESQHLDRLLLINDLINQVNERYNACKKGDWSIKVTIDPTIDPTKGGADAVPTAKITDLISFEDEPSMISTNGISSSSQQQGQAPQSSTSALDDFASLTFDNATRNGGDIGGGVKLPADLFATSPATTSTTTNGAGTATAAAASWGALQLPINNAPAPAPPTSNTTNLPAQLKQSSSAKTGASSSAADPFADLSKW